jgi:nicotinamidase-related amidase
VAKSGIDALVASPLKGALIRHGVTEIAIGGVATNHVVESTARHAADEGFSVFVLGDLCEAHSDALHEHALGNTLPYYAHVTDSVTYFKSRSAVR